MYCMCYVLHEVYKKLRKRHKLYTASAVQLNVEQMQTLTVGLHVISISAVCTHTSQAHVGVSEQQKFVQSSPSIYIAGTP